MVFEFFFQLKCLAPEDEEAIFANNKIALVLQYGSANGGTEAQMLK